MNRSLLSVFLVFAAMAVFLAACKDKEKNELAQRIMPYKYIETTTQVAVVNNDYPAQLQGSQNIDIRPMIDGYIQSVHVDEGQTVRKGQLMFKITNPQYDQQVRSARAALQSAKTQVDNARMQVTKVKPLVDKDIISPFELQSAELQLKSAQAAYAQAQAALSNAQINLGYTNVYAPVSGVVGTLPYRIGSYVNSATPEPLTTVSSIADIYAYFSWNEKDQIEFFKSAGGTSASEKLQSIPDVKLLLADGSEYPHKGVVRSISGQANPQTGSFNMRATFPNPTGLLRSGNSATVRIPNTIYDAVVIPQGATFEIQGAHFVYLVNQDSIVRQAPVTVTDMKDGKRYIVNTGLKTGDKVVVEGVSILKDSTRISPQKTTLDLFVTPDAAGI